MKILLKILVTPFALALSLLAVLLVFLFEICAVLLTIASVILAVLGVALFLPLRASMTRRFGTGFTNLSQHLCPRAGMIK